MSTRRRFRGDFKAKVALEALRGDKTIQEIAARHKIHPNQVSTWKQRAVECCGGGGCGRELNCEGTAFRGTIELCGVTA